MITRIIYDCALKITKTPTLIDGLDEDDEDEEEDDDYVGGNSDEDDDDDASGESDEEEEGDSAPKKVMNIHLGLNSYIISYV